MSNKPTPETESWCGWGIGGLQVVPASFSRKLERERDKAREQRDALAEALKECLERLEHHTEFGALVQADMSAMHSSREALQSITTNEL